MNCSRLADKQNRTEVFCSANNRTIISLLQKAPVR